MLVETEKGRGGGLDLIPHMTGGRRESGAAELSGQTQRRNRRGSNSLGSSSVT